VCGRRGGESISYLSFYLNYKYWNVHSMSVLFPTIRVKFHGSSNAPSPLLSTILELFFPFFPDSSQGTPSQFDIDTDLWLAITSTSHCFRVYWRFFPKIIVKAPLAKLILTLTCSWLLLPLAIRLESHSFS
jgi:hypothetical protein